MISKNDGSKARRVKRMIKFFSKPKSMTRLGGIWLGLVVCLFAGTPDCRILSCSRLNAQEPPAAEPVTGEAAFDDLLDGLMIDAGPEKPVKGKTEDPETAPIEGVTLGDGGPLLAAYQSMVDAQRQLQSTDEDSQAAAGVSVVSVQQSAIDALDQILQQLQSPPEESQAEPQQSEQSMEESPAEDAASQQQGDSQEEGKKPESSEKSEDPNGSPGDGDSMTPEQLQGDPASQQAANQRNLQESVWGHLPDQVRQQLQASLPEQFHPRYQQAIQAYYQALAEAEDQ